jgi:hypothetical protein
MGHFPFGIKNAIFSTSKEKQMGWNGSVAYVWNYITESSPNLYYRRLAGHSGDIFTYSAHQNIIWYKQISDVQLSLQMIHM